MGSMLLVTSTLKGKVIDQNVFTKDKVVVGRHETCDIVLDNPGVSREHVEIIQEARGFVVRDLGSSNGTFVNAERVDRKLLATNDVLKIGKYLLYIRIVPQERVASAGSTQSSPVTPWHRDQTVRAE